MVILAALLAGLRGPENARNRRRIGAGAWLALGVTGGNLRGLAHAPAGTLRITGRRWKPVISVLAVVILLMVTNWVFHKYYWTGWNARLRDLSKAAQRQQQTRWEGLALVGVGFMTIFQGGIRDNAVHAVAHPAKRECVRCCWDLALGRSVYRRGGIRGIFHWSEACPIAKCWLSPGGLVIFVLFTFIGSDGPAIPDGRLAAGPSCSRVGATSMDGSLAGPCIRRGRAR